MARLDVVGVLEIAERLGVQPGTVKKWRQRGRLPVPDAEVSGVPVWRWSSIEKWARQTGRLDHE